MVTEKLTLETIHAAQTRIAKVIRETPLRWSETVSKMVGYSIFVKMENQQKTGSFKLRGAANRLLGGKVAGKGVVAASAGNHAQGVAYAAQKAGVKATIVMPEGAPLTKAEATRNYGAEVIQSGSTYDECYQLAIQLAQQRELEYIHAFDDPLIVAGQGTIGLELLAQNGDLEQIIVPVGGGGLISGIALAIKALKPKAKIIGVQAQGADAVFRTYKRGIFSESETVNTIADGIAVKKPGTLTTEIILNYVDEVITVSDEEIASAMLVALERLKTLVEGAGAAALAAAIYRRDCIEAAPTAVVLSGGNVDVNLMARIIERGLLKAGRLIILQVTIPDRPGNLQRILNIVANQRANVISISHQRLQQDLPLQWTRVTLSLETRNSDHGRSLVQALTDQGLRVEMRQ